jgi:nucleotide-binding universal stress UspA family protein
MKVLLPTDFSDNAHHATDTAISLFGLDGVEYHLLTLYHEPHAAATSMISLVEIALRDAKKSLVEEERLLKAKHGSRLQITTHCEYGEGGNQLARLADRLGVDIMVMGTKGASGLKEVLIGSVAASAVQNSSVPVLVIPSDCVSRKFKSALAAVDDNSDESAIESARAITGALGCTISFVRVLTGEKATEDIQIVKPHYVRTDEGFQVLKGDDLNAVLELEAMKSDVSLIVMFPGRHAFFERLFRRSQTASVAMHAKLPLLTVKKFAKKA